MHVFLWLPDGDIAFISEEHHKEIEAKPENYQGWLCKAEDITDMWKDPDIMRMVYGVKDDIHKHVTEVFSGEGRPLKNGNGIGTWLSEIENDFHSVKG